MNILKILFVLLISYSTSYSQQNCILIIADDVSPDYFGCFSTQTDTAFMPNITNLANQGIRFTQVWSSPVCSPTRAGILTGRYSFRTGVGEVIINQNSAQIDTTEMSIGKILKYYNPTTYKTALIGKWHLNNNAPAKRLNPNKLGFDYYKGNFNGAITDYYNYPVIVNGQTDTVYQYATTQTINDAINWIDTLSTNQPFFIWLAFNAPHSPYHLPPSNLCDVTGLNGTSGHINANKPKYFKAALHALDSEIGRLLQYLEQNGLKDSTNIIIIGDNGNSIEVAQNSNAAHCKNTIYNYGVHVPMIVNGPSVVSPNRNCDQLINTTDIFASIAELCLFTNWNTVIPSNITIDSKSFYSLIKNQNNANRTWIFTEQFSDTLKASDGKTIRNNQYQLLMFDNGQVEFYDLIADSEQNNNLLNQSLDSIQAYNYEWLCDTLNSLIGTNICQTLGIQKDIYQNKINVYPNPSSNHLNILLDPVFIGSELSIHSSIGIEILKRNVSHTTLEIETSNLSSGLYFLKIKSSAYEVTKKIEIH